jgi:subtilisin-like proprotein convertase family protein
MKNFSCKKSVLILTAFFLSNCFSKIYCQTFSNNSVAPISDNDITEFPVSVNNLISIDTTNFGLESVVINISHPDDLELSIQLKSPDGTTILLAKNIQGSGFSNTVFDAKSADFIDFANGPDNKNFRPLNDLAILNNGQTGNGTWKLIVTDNKTGNTGTINSVALNFGNAPAKPLLYSSNLPIIKINTNGNEIVDDPKIVADMNIIYNGKGKINYTSQTDYNYSGKIGIEIRGHSSQRFPKKQFGFETRDVAGLDDLDVSLLGLPEQSDWILSANYNDKTMMRNVLSYQLSREMGDYASRTIYCELIIDNEYKGVYVLMEKIKKDKNRVNIEKLKSSDITPPNVTGGYIFSIDKLDGGEVTWHSSIQNSTVFQFVYPKNAEDIQPEQKQYLQNYVDSFEQALNGENFEDPSSGYRKYIDEKSFMDFFIINELSRNIDGYRISSYFHKPREGKIFAGPVWDYDLAWGNANYFDGSNPIGYDYSYDFPDDDYQVPFWWNKFLQDKLWKQNLVCRYNDYRQNILDQTHIDKIIDSLAEELQYAQQRNFIRWNVMGKAVSTNPTPVPQSYGDEVSALKNWITNRFVFLDNDLGPCTSDGPLALNTEPVILDAKNHGNTNTITWKAESEDQESYFIIESSTDNINFFQVGQVVSRGLSATSNIYNFKDYNVATDVIFYRVKEVDKNGNVSYSKVVPVEISHSAWRIYPNNIHNQLHIYSPLKSQQPVSIRIYNMRGQCVKSTQVPNSTGIVQDVSNLAAGSYVLQVIESGGKITNLRFLKN